MPGEAGETWRNEDEQGKRRPVRDEAVKKETAGEEWRGPEKAVGAGKAREKWRRVEKDR